MKFCLYNFVIVVYVGEQFLLIPLPVIHHRVVGYTSLHHV